MVTTVFMDVDNTLLDFNECSKEAIERAFSDWGLAYHEGVFPVFQQINDELWLQIERQTLTRQQLYQQRWQMIFHQLGIQENGAEFEHSYVNYLRESHRPVAGAPEILEYLASKYLVCAASNSTYSQQYNRLEKANMLRFIQHIFTSEEIGFPKPSREFFDACFSQLGSPAKQSVIIIGDSLTADIQGGTEYGIKTCWFNYNKEPASADLPAD